MQNSQIIEFSTPIVQVLLATYNGEKYLAEFLDSLIGQHGVRIELLVSDDGSTDSTLEILMKYKHSFHTFSFLKGPGKGPTENFLYLIKRSTSQIIALADQDDFWESRKLFTQLKYLKLNEPHAVGHLRSYIGIDSDLVDGGDTQLHVFPTLENALYENILFGNTVMMNQKSARLISNSKPDFIIMHDFYIYLMHLVYGKITIVDERLIRYRIHPQNVVGMPSRTIKLALKNVKLQIKQNTLFLKQHVQNLNRKQQNVAIEYLALTETKSRIKRLFLISKLEIRRNRKLDSFKYKIILTIALMS